MATLALNDVLEARVVCYRGNQTAYNVRHYKVVGVSGTSSTTDAAATAIAGLVDTPYLPLLTDDAFFYGVGVRRILPLPASDEASDITFTAAGTAGSTPLPTQVSGVITFRTGLAGPANRGRIYTPFPDETDNQVTGIPGGTYIADLQTLANNFALPISVGTGGNTAQLVPVLFHRATGGTTAITSAQARAKWGTQRRRGAYGQPNGLPF